MDSLAHRFDYGDLPQDIIATAETDAAAIRESGEKITRSILDIGERLSRQRTALKGRFNAWINAEFEFSRAHAYRFISFYETYNDTDLSGYKLSTTALMHLAQNTIGDDTRKQILLTSKDQPMTVADVKTAIRQAQARRESEIFTLLASAPPVVTHIVGKYGVDNLDTIRMLLRLASRHESDTINEVLSSGFIQPGEEEEAVHITDSSIALESAVRAKAAAHKKEALDRGTVCLGIVRGIITINGDGLIHIAPTESTVLPPDLTGKRVIATIRIIS